MQQQTKSPRHTARAIVLHNDKILLMERWRPGRHYFSIPGGGIEAGETPEATVVREVAEETGCQVKVIRLLYTFMANDGAEHRIFLCQYLSGEPMLPSGSPEALLHNPDNRFQPRWVKLTELPELAFNRWQHVMGRLRHDLERGLPGTPQKLA